MVILGIESSCDETAAAVLSAEAKVLSNVVSSQIEIHRQYGGVVPELASRHHLQNIVPVIQEALDQARLSLDDIEGVAVTCGPGLVGALLVGLQSAKAIAYARRLPLIGINHLEGHLCAPRLLEEAASLPERHVALMVSGGHTALILVEEFGKYRFLGASRDDAAGEAFDKVAKLLGLGYPGGPVIEKYAEQGDPQAIKFPRALPRRDELDFSFSGLKTAVAWHVREHGAPSGQGLADFCASFQRAVADVLIRKTCFAVRKERVKAVVAAGGVMANKEVRRCLIEAAAAEGFSVFIPPIKLCTDNAAMIALAGQIRLLRNERSDWSLNAMARLTLAI